MASSNPLHNLQFVPVANTPDYMSANGEYYATYKHSYGGYATYWIHTVSIAKSKRTQAKAICVGGLPGQNKV